jgi:cation/acetate symporter
VIYEPSALPIVVFFLFLAFTLGLSFYLGRRARSSAGYFAAHGQIPWFVNGVAFAGDYLSAASFLGICGMIAFYGYDGFLYSIGYLAGWIVALFVIAEPMKRLGKFTFADALDATFQSRGVKLAVGISTLAVSVFYLIPQMVGAGVLVTPLLGFPHWVGVVLVGSVVILIVVTAGMVSTTWVQFLKGSLLVAFSLVLTVMILVRGLEARSGGIDGYELRTLGPLDPAVLRPASGTTSDDVVVPGHPHLRLRALPAAWYEAGLVQTLDDRTGETVTWSIYAPQTPQSPQTPATRELPETAPTSDAPYTPTTQPMPQGTQQAPAVYLLEAQTVSVRNGTRYVNGKPQQAGHHDLHPVGHVRRLPGGISHTGPLGPLEFFSTLQRSEVSLWRSARLTDPDGDEVTVYYQKPTPGTQVLRPGENPSFAGIRSPHLSDKLNFISLMLALFCGTASLPHILIRYYTVKDAAAARKSTIVGIASIGFFYVLTLYMGLGAMTSGALDVTNSNMAAPLLARSMASWLFAVISAIAFTTVLGTVSGLILASAGAIAHDLAGVVFQQKLTDHEKVRLARLASFAVGAVAIVLGIVFQGMNVTFLVGWAFSVAASANLPSLVMLLFWKGATRQGVVAAVLVGMISSLAWILLSADTFKDVYGLEPNDSPVPFSQPGIVTIPLGFVTLWVVSRWTQPRGATAAAS